MFPSKNESVLHLVHAVAEPSHHKQFTLLQGLQIGLVASVSSSHHSSAQSVTQVFASKNLSTSHLVQEVAEPSHHRQFVEHALHTLLSVVEASSQ